MKERYEFIDTHAHYDDDSFKDGIDDLILEFKENNIKAIINNGATQKGCHNSILLAKKYDNFFATVGIHPDEVETLKEEDIFVLEELAKNKKVVAIGEIGLDYHNMGSSKEKQKYWFEKQLNLAIKLNLPVVIHSRESALDTYEIYEKYASHLKVAELHCYSYSKEMAKLFLEKGAYFGIGGVVTFKNAKKLVEVVEYLPLDRILLETDAPYLSPTPFRGKQNKSTYIKYVIEKIAEIKGVCCEEVARVSTKNAETFFLI